MTDTREDVDHIAADARHEQVTAARAAVLAAIEQQLPVDSVLLATERLVTAELQVALVGRAVIEQAKGIVMGERRCSPDEAFAILADVASRSERKVQAVAHALVESARERPQAGTPQDPER